MEPPVVAAFGKAKSATRACDARERRNGVVSLE